MKKIYTLIFLIFLINTAFAQVAIEWQKCLGGSNSDIANTIYLTNDGGYITAGSTDSNNGDVTLNHGGTDAWIVKMDSNGNIEWQKSYGGTNIDFVSDIIQTSDGGFIFSGATNSSDGDVTGLFGSWDIWIVRLDSIGNIQWQKCFGGTSLDEPGSIIEVSNGYVFVGSISSNTGNATCYQGNSRDVWLVNIDFVGNIIWQKCGFVPTDERGHSVRSTSDGGFLITGDRGSLSSCIDGLDIFVVKTDSLGNVQNQFCGGSPDDDVSYLSIPTSDNGFILVGYVKDNGGNVSGHHGDFDIWVAKFGSNFNLQWQKPLGGAGIDMAFTIIENNDGSYLLAGEAGSVDGDINDKIGGSDYWIVKLDNNGNILYTKSIGGTSYERPTCIAATNDNKYIISGGSASNDIDVFGNHGGNWDYWVVKFSENINLITGKTFIDSNSNSLYDVGELVIKNHQVYELNTGRYSFSGYENYYLAVLDSGNFIISSPPIPYYWPAPINHSVYFSGINQVDSLNDFAFQPLGTFNDLEVTLTPLTPFRPGFDAHYNIHYKNVGTTALAGTVIFAPDSNITFVSASIAPNVISIDSIYWTLPVLNPFDEGNILVTVQVDVNSVLGSITNSGTKIEPVTGDAYSGNNQYWWEVEVTGSFDPNDILVNKETITTTELANSTYLEYLIRFQNTGTDTAFTVKVMNNLIEMLDVSTFEFVNSSHPIEINYGNHSRLFEFKFNNILLPDSNTNELLSHGYVRYRIKPLTTLTAGDSIENTAAIYFDFNAPVITNTAVTKIVLPISIPQIKNDFNFSLYPNPTTGELNISFNLEKNSDINLELFNSLGQIIKIISHKKLNAGENKFNFSTENIPPGIYHLKFSVDGNVVAKKVIKM